MNIKQLIIVIALCMVIMGSWVVWVRRGTSSEGPMMDVQDNRQDAYRGTHKELMVAFGYPKGWPLKEEAGQIETYREVRIKGPRNTDDTFSLLFAVRSSPLREHGGKFRSIDELIQHHLSHVLAGGRIVARTERMVDGQPAQDITVEYVIPPLHQPRLKAIKIPVRSRTLFLEHHGRLYELIYHADARQYDAHRDAFERLLTTFRFL